MRGSRPYRPETTFASAGFPGGRPAPDLIALIAVVFATYALQFFSATGIVPALLRLTPAAWRLGWVWQFVTYAFIGFGGPSPWILLELLVLFWFANDVRTRLGRRRFWSLLLAGAVASALAAAVVQVAASAVMGGSPTAAPFQLMQGQRTLLTIAIAAFAVLWGDATILLFFVVPVRARWCLWLGVLLGFVAYLGSKDLAGFAGICAATAFTALRLGRRPGRARVRRLWLEWRRRRIGRKLDRLARRRGMRVVRRDDDDGPTIN